MANRLRCLLPLLAVLMACSTNGSPPETTASGSAPQQVAIEKLRIPLGDPVLIDSSDYVMYPLSLSNITAEEESSYGSSYRQASTYWNVIFYNSRSNQRHLLSTQKMLIHAYSGQDFSSPPSAGLGKGRPQVYAADNLLYFSITTADFDHDGQLTADDPTYLFISNKSGENFRQLSPDSLHVTGWEIQRNTGKILLQAMQDSNHDRKFGAGDESIPYVYDLATQLPAQRIFSPPFINQLRSQFQQQWPQKP